MDGLSNIKMGSAITKDGCHDKSPLAYYTFELRLDVEKNANDLNKEMKTLWIIPVGTTT